MYNILALFLEGRVSQGQLLETAVYNQKSIFHLKKKKKPAVIFQVT